MTFVCPFALPAGRIAVIDLEGQAGVDRMGKRP
jgi:hypothetical protein